jgi:hypothetical protein
MGRKKLAQANGFCPVALILQKFQLKNILIQFFIQD